MKNRINIAVSVICGLLFIPVEVGFRAINGSMMKYGYDYGAFMGFSSLHMIWVAALTVFMMGRVTEGKLKRTFAWFVKVLKAALIGTVVEFISGLILNVWLGLNIWNYSNVPGNIMGQVAPQFALYWLILVPIALWMDDVVTASIDKIPRLRDYYFKSFFWWIK